MSFLCASYSLNRISGCREDNAAISSDKGTLALSPRNRTNNVTSLQRDPQRGEQTELPRNKTATATVSGNTGASERICPFLPFRVPNVFVRPISKFFQTDRKEGTKERGRKDRQRRQTSATREYVLQSVCYVMLCCSVDIAVGGYMDSCNVMKPRFIMFTLFMYGAHSCLALSLFAPYHSTPPSLSVAGRKISSISPRAP